MPTLTHRSSAPSLLTRRARLFTVLVLVLSAAASTRPAPVHAVGQFSGTVPGPGGLALLVWSGGPVQEIGSALAATACSPRSVWATRRSGGLIGYLFGAPDAVNSGFRAEFAGATLPPQTPVVLVCAGASAPAPTAGALEQSEAQMFALINQARAANGLAPFTLDPALVEVARRHSADMVARGFFAHINPDGLDPFERMAAAGITYSSAAENIGWAGDATLAHNALMNSPVHRANLLNPQLGRIGVGIVRKDSLHIMVTQLFRD